MSTPINEAVEREAFEAAYGPKDSFAWRNEDGTYKVQLLQLAWEIWLRRAALPPPIVEPVNVIGKLLEEFSALPVLWGLDEPGALVRHRDVFRLLIAASKLTPASAPSDGAADARDAALEEAAKVCESYEADLWNLYKGRHPYTGSEPGRACDIVQGKSCGAGLCADAIRDMKSVASTHTTTGGEEPAQSCNAQETEKQADPFIAWNAARKK